VKNPLKAYDGLPREVYWLFTARLVTSMGSFIMPLLTLILTQKLGLTAARAGWFITVLAASQAPCLALGGRLADTIGRKKLLLVSYFGSAAAYLLCAFLGGHSMVACIVAAADLAVLGMPASDALLSDIVGPAQRKAAYSLLYFGMNMGITVSMLLGGLLFQNFLPLLFFLDALTTICCGCIVACRVHERYRIPAAPDGPAMRAAQAEGKAAVPSLAAVLHAAPAVFFFVLLMFLYDFCYSQWTFLLPAQMGEQFGGAGARLYSMLVVLNGALIILCTPAVTLFSARIEPLWAMAVGGALYGGSYLVFAAGHSMLMYALASALLTFGEIVCTIQIGSFLADRTPAACRGRVNAFSNFVRGAGSSSSPAVTGELLPVLGYGGAWLLMAALMAAGTAGMALLHRLERKQRRV
jgi:MFS family permease